MGEQLQKPAKPIPIFISYAPVRADESLRQRLESHLRLMDRQGLIEPWSSERVGPGEKWVAKTSAKLDAAQVILLLVSADYVASDPHWREMQRAMARHDAGEARVIPVLLSPCDWRTAPLGRLDPLPRDGRPITLWHNPDEAWADVVHGVRQVLTDAAAAPPSARPAKALGRQLPGVAIAAAIGVSVALVAPLGAILVGFDTPSATLMTTARHAPAQDAAVDSSALFDADIASDSGASLGVRAQAIAHPVPLLLPKDPVDQPSSYRGVIFSDRPVPNVKVLLLGTRCTATTDNTGVFDFAGCNPADVSRLSNPTVHIRFQGSNRTCTSPLHLPPKVTRIDVTQQGCKRSSASAFPNAVFFEELRIDFDSSKPGVLEAIALGAGCTFWITGRTEVFGTEITLTLPAGDYVLNCRPRFPANREGAVRSTRVSVNSDLISTVVFRFNPTVDK